MNMHNSFKDKVESLGKKIQLTVTISLFFPVLVKALFDLSGLSPKEISGTTLQLGIIIFFCHFKFFNV